MLIVLEGLDGIGKTTQVKHLITYFKKQGRDCEFLHFPRIDTPPFGPLIQQYLQGTFGPLKDIHPYLSASLYASDQYLAFRDILDHTEQKILFLDRYYYSNLAYQSARLPKEEQATFMQWLEEVIDSFHLPEPDLALYLHGSSQKFRRENLKKRSTQDLHEIDQDYQYTVHKKYLEICKIQWKNLHAYDCTGHNSEVKDIQSIHNDLIKLLEKKIPR
ncbi:MAG: deoxynucleoside kinase [Spirochaetia bacterium]